MIFGKKKKDDSASVFKKINKKAIKYCSQRDESGETILGKKGAINVFDDEITIVCDGTIVFRCSRKGAKAFELMSLGGVTIDYIDDDGEKSSVTAYYTSP